MRMWCGCGSMLCMFVGVDMCLCCSHTGSRVSNATNSSQGSTIVAPSPPMPSPPAADEVCSVQTQMCIDKFKCGNHGSIPAGTMIIHNIIELKATLVYDPHDCPHVMLKLDPIIPRQFPLHIALAKTYELLIAIREKGTESDVLSEDITKLFTLKDKVLVKLLPKEKWLDSGCSRINVVIKVIEKELHVCVSEPTAELDYVNISFTQQVCTISKCVCYKNYAPQ